MIFLLSCNAYIVIMMFFMCYNIIAAHIGGIYF